MSWPPMFIRLKIPYRNRRGNFGLWLPIFLAYPFILALAILLAPLVLIAALIAWPSGWGRTILLSGPMAFCLLWSLRGLRVDVRQPRGRLYINIA